MSTLTSAQLCVKRSSTRLHAPPGGHSSLSFGPGGFGTTDAADKAEADLTTVPHTSASSRNGFSRGGCAYDGDSGANSNYYAVSAPPPSSSGRGGDDPRGFYAPPPSSSATARPLVSSASTRWGAQPPLTASKRDQNWERKRREWLARKHAGGSARSDALPPPSASCDSGGWPAGDGPLGSAMPPSSPLSKFMHQHADRLPTAGYYYCDDADRGRAEGGFGPPPTAQSGYYGAPYPPPASRDGGLPSRGGSPASTRAGSRQPPGGRSNWSPFS